MNQKYQAALDRIVKDAKKLTMPCRPAGDDAEKIWKDLISCARILDTNPRLRCSGLAANQLGYTCRVIVVKNARGMFKPYINPAIVSAGPLSPSVESCFSFPGKTSTVQRSRAISITADNIHGCRPLRGHEAVCFQHELDHLNGVLI